MKIFNKLTIALAAVAISAAAWAQNQKPFVVPELTQWTGAEGTFTITPTTRIVAGRKVPAEVVKALAADYATVTGKTLAVSDGRAKDGDIQLSIKADKRLGAEGYAMSIGKRIELSATTQTGLYWATRTLLQLAAQNGGAIPCGSTVDVPRYEVRGMLFDVGRKYIPLDYLRKLVKMMAYYKMNTLQVHLNDDGGMHYENIAEPLKYTAFRLECDTYPGLTATDGSYSKADFRQFQKDAAAIGVNIIPEIDSPAHSASFIHYNPRLRSKNYDESHLDLLNPETIPFMEALWREYLEGDDPVFVGKDVNIGTDEYSNKDSVVVEAFRSYADHFIRFAESYGKRAGLWGSLTHAKGKTPVKAKGVTMNLWYNGYADPKAMLAAGYRGISIPDGWVYIVPRAGYYYDYLNCEKLYKEWNPSMVGDVKFADNEPGLVGGMFAVWNDANGNGISVKDIHHRIFPALQTMAVKCWTAQLTSLPWDEFKQKSASMIEAPGINELARYGKPHSLVVDKAAVSPGEKLPIPEIGYDYTVDFIINGAAEKPGTVLFRSPNAVVYLSDPIAGQLAFARDGYLYKLNYGARAGSNDTIRITGNNQRVRMFVNGRLRNDLTPLSIKLLYEKFEYMSTLVFPLQEAGDFRSKITNLKVYNYEMP